MVVWRYLSTGIPDLIEINANAAGGTEGDDEAFAVMESIGGFLVAGSSRNGYDYMTAWSYNSSGVLNSAFDGDGILALDGGNGDDRAFGMMQPLSTANPLIAGMHRQSGGGTNSDMGIWHRSSTDGSAITGFGAAGFAFHADAAGASAGDDVGRAIGSDDANGRVLVAGYSSNASGNTDMVEWGYKLSDGTLDTTFGTNGIVVYDGGNGDDQGWAIYVDSSTASPRFYVTG